MPVRLEVGELEFPEGTRLYIGTPSSRTDETKFKITVTNANGAIMKIRNNSDIGNTGVEAINHLGQGIGIWTFPANFPVAARQNTAALFSETESPIDVYVFNTRRFTFRLGGGVGMTTISTPAAPPANEITLYADTSGGKVRLMALFPTGAAQVIASEP